MDAPPTDKLIPPAGVHRFKSRLKRGKVVELQDDSQWEISPGYEVFTDHWSTDTDVTVVPGGYPNYPYDLINPATGDRVPVRFHGFAHSPATWRLIEN